MLSSRNRPLRGVVLVLDALLVVASIALAGGLHAALRGHWSALKEPPHFGEYATIVYIAVPLWLVLAAVLGLHRTFEHVWTRVSLAFDLLKLHVAGFIGLSVALFFTQSTINRSLVFLFLGCSFLLMYFVRSALGFWQRFQYTAGQSRQRLLLVGADGPQLQEIKQLAAASQLPPVLVGHVGPGEVEGVPHLGAIEDLPRILHDQSLDRVVFFPPYHRAPDVTESIAACELVGVSAELAIESAPSLATPRVVDMYGRPFISFDTGPNAPQQLALKHAFDWLVSLIALLVLAPLLLVVSLAILVTMGRPVLFAQNRAGLYGRQFRMLKFRTMVKDAEAKQATLVERNEMTGPVFKVSADPRITRLGRFLRNSSIDELPQLINVLLGHMSLVGPRPLPIKEQQNIHGWHRRRLSMKPGITGIWQVSGRNNIDFEEWMKLDQRYIDDWSLRLDFVILVKTLPAVLLRRGAR